MRAYLYIVASSADPDSITCEVPYEVDADEIFFGPCKKRLRQQLRRDVMRGKDSAVPDEEIFLIGFNGSNGKKIRKIVWAGRITRLMTFGRAEKELTGERYREMLQEPKTPLHLRARSDGMPGYEHHGALHADDWLADVASDSNPSGLRQKGRRLEVDGEAGAAALTRDACMLLENIYFAGKRSACGAGGIAVDDQMVKFLKVAQNRDDVDAYGVFGRRSDGSAEGLTGRWLLLQDPDAAEFMSLLRARLPRPRKSRAIPGPERMASEKRKVAGGRKC